MTTPLINRGTADLIYSYMLSSAYQSPWVYDPSGADLRDPDIWEILRNQTDMLAEINRRNNSMVRPWRVAPNYHSSYSTKNKLVIDQSKQLASIAHEGLSHCSNLDEARVLLAQDFFLGRSYGLSLWEPVYCSLDGTPEMLWYLPTKIKDIDRRRVHWVPDWEYVDSTGKTISAGSQTKWPDGRETSTYTYTTGGYRRKSGIHLELFNTDAWRWERVDDEMRRNLIESIYYDEEDRLGYGRGVIEAGFFTHYFLTGTFQKVMEGLDRFANGVLVGKIDSLRNASSDKTNEDVKTAMMSVLNTYRSQHYILLQDGDDVEIKESTGSGFNMSMEWIDRLVQSWARLCNGSIRSAGHSDGTGSKAAASEEGDTSEAFYQVDRTRLDHSMDRDFLGAFLYHNQDNIRALGLDKAKRPKFTSEQIKRQSPEIAVTTITAALAAGMPLLKREAYDRIEFTPPADDDDVIEGSSGGGMPGEEFGGGPEFGGGKPPFGDKGDKPEKKDEGEAKDEKSKKPPFGG